jgi:hypothetical protein
MKNQIRPRITPAEFNLVLDHRKERKAFLRHCKERGIDPETVNEYWDKTKEFSVRVKGPSQKTYEDVRDQVIEEMRKHAPAYKTLTRSVIKDPHLLVISPADLHIGKICTAFETGEEYDSNIAVKRALEGVEGLIKRASGYEIERVLLIIGNDILHVDNPDNKTTKGTRQDVSEMWYTSFLKAKRLYVEIIELLTAVADVHIVFNPSNHDYMSGFMLADSVFSWFHKAKNITFDVSPSHRKYFRYVNNLIGSTHGDGARGDALPLLMADESPDWSNCRHRYFYTHHRHHKEAKDRGSVAIESFRSPTATDSYHHKHGYQHAPQALEAFIHHPTNGQVARLSYIY